MKGPPWHSNTLLLCFVGQCIFSTNNPPENLPLSRILSALQSNACTILTLCNPNFNISNLRAWELLRRILEEKPFVQAYLPFDLVNWIIDESRQDTQSIVPSKVDELEKEVHEFRQRLESDNINKQNADSEVWTKGWKKWEGEWIPRPIGV